MPYRLLPLIFLLGAACSSVGDDPIPTPGTPGGEEAPAAPAPVEEPPLPPADDLVVRITNASVGCLEIGATPEAVRDACGSVRDTTLAIEGMEQPALIATVNGSTALVEIVDGVVWRITVTDPGVATEEGIGVGTRASRLAGMADARVNTGEGQYFVTVPALCGLSFGLEGVPFDASPPTIEELRASPESVRVSEVLVLGAC